MSRRDLYLPGGPLGTSLLAGCFDIRFLPFALKRRTLYVLRHRSEQNRARFVVPIKSDPHSSQFRMGPPPCRSESSIKYRAASNDPMSQAKTQCFLVASRER